jgi:hypothetical protein
MLGEGKYRPIVVVECLEPRLDLQNNRDISLLELRYGFEVRKIVVSLSGGRFSVR